MSTQPTGSDQVPNVEPSVPVEPDVDLSTLPPVPNSPGDHTTDQRSDYSHKRVGCFDSVSDFYAHHTYVRACMSSEDLYSSFFVADQRK